MKKKIMTAILKLLITANMDKTNITLLYYNVPDPNSLVQ